MLALFNKIEVIIKKYPTRSAAVILGLLVLFFISPAFFQGRFLAPVDTTHYVAPYLDITTQMLPWWNLSKEIIRSGHFPFWNIFSGNGLPLMANMQSAVFFPLSWLFYVFNVRWALLFYSFAKLFLMGFFTYLYLKELKLSYYVSLIGAVMFAFCGANVIWFLWPLTSVILILPLSFFVIERYFNTRDVKTVLWLAPITAFGLFAGHPQTFFYIFLVIYSYTVFKSFASGLTIRLAVKELAIISGFYVLGFLMSAIAVLPFLEYLKLSANLNYRAGFAENPFYLQPLMFITNLIPDFYGNTGVKNFSYLLVPNYGEVALGYIGASGLILSLFSFGKKMRKEIIFFAAMSLLVLALIYHAPIIYFLINKLPGFSLNYNNRLLYVWAFFLTVLACFGLQNLIDGKISVRRVNYSWLGFGVFGLILIAINRIITKSWNFAHNLDWYTVSLWQDVMIAAFIANLVISYLVIKKLPKKSALACLFILIFIETGIHGMIFMKTSAPANFYPSEPALNFLASQYKINQGRVFTYGDNLLPNIGTWYGIDELNDHDTIYLTSNKKLKNYVGNYNYSPEYTFGEPNLNALRFLSVKYLLYPPAEGAAMLKKHPADLTLDFSDANYAVLGLSGSFPRAYMLNASGSDDLNSQLADLIGNPKSHPIKPVSGFQIAEDGTEKISYNMTGDNYLIMTDNYYPDWLANFSSGHTEKIQNAFGLRVVPVAPGQGNVTISYRSKSFQLGLEISAAALLAWIILVVFIKKLVL
jgi:hypothetical protein